MLPFAGQAFVAFLQNPTSNLMPVGLVVFFVLGLVCLVPTRLGMRAHARCRRGSDPRAVLLQHLVNHASYHRQVTTMIRQLGAPAPKPQDLIRFYRERGT